MMVGSTANLGFKFRMTAAGGVIWACMENFGSFPFEAWSTSRSPPPPPPTGLSLGGLERNEIAGIDQLSGALRFGLDLGDPAMPQNCAADDQSEHYDVRGGEPRAPSFL